MKLFYGPDQPLGFGFGFLVWFTDFFKYRSFAFSCPGTEMESTVLKKMHGSVVKSIPSNQNL
jgi:hypothetical protein